MLKSGPQISEICLSRVVVDRIKYAAGPYLGRRRAHWLLRDQ